MSVKLTVRNLNVPSLDDEFTSELEVTSGSETSIDSVLHLLANRHQSIQPSQLELSYGGQLLDRQSTLEKYVPVERKRATMYLVQLHEISAHGDKDVKPSPSEVATLVNLAISVFKRKPRRHYLERVLQTPSKFFEILGKEHQLKYDATAISFVRSYDLLKSLTDATKCDQCVKSNVNIYAGAKAILSHVRENARSEMANSTDFVSKVSYYIDEMSEDDEPRPHPQQQPYQPQPQARRFQPSQQPTQPIITQDYLSSVLASLSRQTQPAAPAAPAAATSNAQTQPTAPQPSQLPAQVAVSAPSQATARIERTYFQDVMQQLFAASTPPASSTAGAQQQQAAVSNTSQPPSANASEQQQQQQQQQQADLAGKLQTMHEFGFVDDELNMRALQVAQGDVELALSLIVDGSL